MIDKQKPAGDKENLHQRVEMEAGINKRIGVNQNINTNTIQLFLHNFQLEHIYHLVQGEETLSVYLEYVSGGSIHKLLQEYGAFGEPVIQNYTRQILSGLAYLHERNTVHRDIKGANILVDPNGEIKLADFGMAKHITNCTSMLSFKGSPYWMAPEVVMNSNGYNLAVDIWSLGCTILEMATSKPPWGQYEGMYKGELRDGSLIAIRCHHMNRRDNSQSYMNHLEILSKLRHQHLVSALGHCFDYHLDDSSVSRIFLVFEYAPNGTLRDWISERRDNQMLTWSQPIAAAIGVAKSTLQGLFIL
ncbi:hypothetical protein POM88_025143 [Heracleum sosnowskyi]|uniref:Protein kinase domain-containing protein n=1 Tax=Heracleum sosnowskyi TaxID=360622 RepID=A0AAD8I3G4_9APIA|nr:hypothetical protein POM88_025143 [Heracleum sosnowskyi]